MIRKRFYALKRHLTSIFCTARINVTNNILRNLSTLILDKTKKIRSHKKVIFKASEQNMTHTLQNKHFQF